MTVVKKPVALSLLLLLIATKGSFAQSTTNARPVLFNIIYKKLADGELKLDIYQPQSSGDHPNPVVVYLHGGGWTTGDKSEIHNDYREDILQAMLAKGYAVVSVDYRLTNADNMHFPAPVIDCKDAVRWLRKNAKSFHFDPENIGVWGTSAGAHMGMLLAYTDDKDFYGAPELRPYSARVNYVLDNYGPVDLNELFRPEVSNLKLWLLKYYSRRRYDLRKSRLINFSGLDIDQQKDKVTDFTRLYSPIHYVNAQTVPTFIIHGDHDGTVPLKQAKLLDQALLKNNVPHQLIVYPGEGHGLKTLTSAQKEHLTQQSLLFMDKYKK